jgi:hypothetical protein
MEHEGIMRAPNTIPDTPIVKTAFVMRADQLEAIDRVAKQADLNRSQMMRRLLDLGLKHWTDAATRES